MHSGRGSSAGELPDDNGDRGLTVLVHRQVRVVFEAGWIVADIVGERDPQLQSVHRRGMLGRGVFRVGDPAAGSHQIELSGPDHLMATQAVAVLDDAVDKPRDGLQCCVRVRWDLHARATGDIIGAEVVDETPRTDHPPLSKWQQPTHGGVTAQRHVVARQQHTLGIRHVRDGGGVHGLLGAHVPTLRPES